jgi:hypothetical protein
MSFSWKILLVLLLPSSGVWAQVQAARSYDFYNSVGVNTHWYYDDNFQYQPHFQDLINLMKQAGIYHFRDGEFAQGDNTPSWITHTYAQLAANGMKAELIVANGQTLSELEFGLKQYPGLEAIEPPNEWDANGGNDWASTLLAQLPLIKQAGEDLGLTVVGPSLIQTNDAAKLGDVSQYMNFDNMHSYSGGRNPETTGWGDNDAEGNAYGSLAWNLDMVHEYGPNLQAYATETGYQSTNTPVQNEVPEKVAGTYAPRMALYYFKNGVPRTYFYELIDDPAGAQTGYGLLRYDLSPKPAFTAISNLLQILKDANTQFTPGSLDYSLSGDMNGVESLLLQKGNGDFYLSVWLDGSIYDVNALKATPQTPQQLTLTLPASKSVASVASFNSDGTISESTPNQSIYVLNANSCVTTIRIVDLESPAPPQPPPPPPPPAPPSPTQPTVAAPPTFSIAAGTYTSAQTVALGDLTPGAQIYYTTDNSTPTAQSKQYKGALTVGQSETIRAIAMAPGYSESPSSFASYTISLPAADYSLAVTPQTITVLPGQSASATVSIKSQNGFDSPVKLTCSGLPGGTSCKFSPAGLTPSGSTAVSTTLTVASSPDSDMRQRDTETTVPGGTLALVLCCMGWRRRKTPALLCLLMLGAIGLTLLAGCASFTVRTQNLVTSTVTVTATSGSLQHAATFSLTTQ